MMNIIWLRPARSWASCFSALALGAGLSSAHAQSANLITNPNFLNVSASTALPEGYFDQVFFSSCAVTEDPKAKVAVQYSYGTEGQPYIEIDLLNTSANCTANYNLFLPVANTHLSVEPGAAYAFSAQYKVLTYDGKSGGNLGYNLERADKGYLGGSGTDFDSTPADYRTATNRYLAGIPVNGEVPAYVLPGMSRYSLQPGGHLRLRMRAPSISYTPPATTVNIGALVNTTPMIASGKLLKLTVPLTPIPVSGSITSRIALIDANGVEQYSTSHAAPYFGSTSWAPVVDGWQVTPPATLPQGRYAIRYSLTVPASQTSAGTGVKQIVAANGSKSYELGHVVVDNKAGMYVGQHFHRYPGPAESLGPIKVSYQFARSLNHDGITPAEDGLTYMSWWKGDGVYDWTLFDKWANYHAGTGTSSVKKLLITFFGSPRWNSSNPDEPNPYGPGAAGLTSAPADLTKYQKMVSDTVTRYKGRIFAVECWNEPDFDFFEGDTNKPGVPLPQQLADVCKAIHVATKAVDPSIATICPQVAVPENMKTWLGAKTSAGEPITQFCDMVGAHTYSRNGSDAAGKEYGPGSLSTTINNIKRDLSELGVNKPIAITEAGFYDGSPAEWSDGKVFSSKTGAERAAVIYQTLATARELGVTLFGLYSYDGGPDTGTLAGLEGTASANTADNQTVYQRMSQAVTDLGVSGNGLQAITVDVFQLPSKTLVNYSKDTKVSFAITLANTGLLPVKNVGLANAASSTLLVFDSASGGTCSTSTSQVRCTLGTLNPGESKVIVINGRVNPTSGQKTNMTLWGTKYTVNHAASVQWDLPTLTSATVKTASDTKTITVAR